MIVKMKKLTLLVSEKERENFLKSLRALGVIHVKNIKKPSADELSIVENTVTTVKNAISILEPYSSLRKGAKAGPVIARRPAKQADEACLAGRQAIPSRAKEIVSLAEEKSILLEGLGSIEKEIEWFKPWGGFDPGDIAALQEKGIFTRLYRAKKNALKTIKERTDAYIVRKDAQYAYIAQISKNADDTLPFEEIKPAKESLASCLRKRENLKKEIDEIDVKFKAASRTQGPLKQYLDSAGRKCAFLSVMHGMGEEGQFSYLAGFCPINRVKDVTALAKSAGAGYLVEDPDKPEEVPTLIKNPKWVRIVNPVFKFMNTIPGYGEHDISLWFLIFFSLFFAMLISDAGYGLLFIALTFFARKKLKKMPPEPFLLMYLLSFSTIIWGAITGTWFGSEKIAALPFLNLIVVDKINGLVEDNQNFMIYLCFVIGVVQLSLAHLLLAVKKINSLKAIAELGWVALLWGLFFTAGMLVLERNLPSFAVYLFAGGVLTILLFSNPQKNIIRGVLTTLADLPLKIISSFSDVVSYLRLFAVGYASTVLAVTFNNMALDIGFNGFFASLAGAFVLFFGHTLNIVLGLMAVIVHGIRLNMLEFSGQMGMEWSGKEYNPFCETS
ncbi:MAG: hypothetical protein NG740_04180 [Omnitrophica bacterium]|nr:hypothetical protein [Candidatus Omnitrophota bacterium]